MMKMMVLHGVFGKKAYYLQLQILSDLNMQLTTALASIIFLASSSFSVTSLSGIYMKRQLVDAFVKLFWLVELCLYSLVKFQSFISPRSAGEKINHGEWVRKIISKPFLR